MLELTQLTGVNLSIYIILLGAILLYFGKVVADTKVEKYDKLEYYIEGLIFSALYIFIPSLFAYYAKDFFKFPTIILIIIQVAALVLLSFNFYAHEYLRKHGLLDEFKKISEQKLTEIKEQESFVGKLVKSKYGEEWFKSNYGMSYTDSFYKISILFGNKGILGVISFLTILSNFQFYESGELLTFGISLLFTFLILTLVATAYGFNVAYYPPAKVYLTDGETLEGKVLKFGDFVYVLNGNKKFFINKDKIKYLEESLFKEEKKA